jgi:hypothetical protein
MEVEHILMAMNPRTTNGAALVQNPCHHCKHRREMPGNAHISCAKPDADMTGDLHGIQKGWFMYPMLYDPTWMTAKCRNAEINEAAVSPAVSDAVIRE